VFASHIEQILDQWGITPETKAALYDLYVSMGDEILEVFAELAESVERTDALTPAHTEPIRALVVERFLRRNHPQWLEGRPTPSLWHPRVLEGRASGLANPIGDVPDDLRAIVGDDQPLPDGMVMLGRNAHYGGRQETVSFDVITRSLADAIAVGTAVGQQHTLPGSIGETSATHDATRSVGLIWEVQPNVYKPADDRNRAITKVYRRHRNWHLVTLAIALRWMMEHCESVFVLRGIALATTHEVNPEKPVSPEIAAMHDRTVARVTNALGLSLADPSDLDEITLLDSIVMNHALRKHVLRDGAVGSIWRVTR
jgi:hypothetical protein